jgi:hypothetical protein
MSEDHVVEEYRNCKIVANKEGGNYRGCAWKAGKRIFEAEGADLAQLRDSLRDKVDSTFRAHGTPLSADAKVHKSVRALQAIWPSLTTGQKAMLRAHFFAPNQTITATQLSQAAGYDSWHAANLHYGKVGFAVHEIAPQELPLRADGTPIYTFGIATEGLRTGSSEAEWPWKLRPEMASAIEQMGLFK